jgi:hypothetical protein
MRRSAALLLLVLAACGSTPSARGSRAPAAPALPPGWGRLEPLLRDAERAQAAADADALARLSPAIEREGLSLLQANPPNTLPRHAHPRFLEARREFGDALVALARARETDHVPDLGPFVLRVIDAYHGWMAVIRGAPPERSL